MLFVEFLHMTKYSVAGLYFGDRNNIDLVRVLRSQKWMMILMITILIRIIHTMYKMINNKTMTMIHHNYKIIHHYIHI